MHISHIFNFNTVFPLRKIKVQLIVHSHKKINAVDSVRFEEVCFTIFSMITDDFGLECLFFWEFRISKCLKAIKQDTFTPPELSLSPF